MGGVTIVSTIVAGTVVTVVVVVVAVAMVVVVLSTNARQRTPITTSCRVALQAIVRTRFSSADRKRMFRWMGQRGGVGGSGIVGAPAIAPPTDKANNSSRPKRAENLVP